MWGREASASRVVYYGVTAVLGLGLLPVQALAVSYRVTIHQPDARSAPGEVAIVAPIATEIPLGDYRLLPDGESTPLPARVFKDGGKLYLGTVLKRSAPAQTFRMSPTTKDDNYPAGVEIRPGDGPNLEIRVAGKPFTVYRADEPSKPYFYPVIGPTGDSFTRAYPMQKEVPGETKDHPHQRAFWFTYGNVNGYDFWASDPHNKSNPKLPFGTVKDTSRETSSGSAVGVLHTTDDWLGPDGKKVCEDERVVRIYDTATTRIMDVEVTLKATAGPLAFNDTKEGMFGLRVASSMDVDKKQGGKITNAEGLTDAAAWGKASPWVDYVGPVEGKTVGVAILNHPDSFRYPTTWHVRTYGLFAANPFGWHDFGLGKTGQHTVPAGESVQFKYRVILHEGNTESAKIAEAFKAYSTPARVEVAVD
jgi:Methane oxygenase PmoA